MQTARKRLRSALIAMDLVIEWTEWDTFQMATPTELRGFGSPTVFVDGQEVMGGRPGIGMACSVAGAPSFEILVAALNTRGP